MSQDHLIGFQCTKCNRIISRSTKNKKNVKDRLELKKHCKFCLEHTLQKETKV